MPPSRDTTIGAVVSDFITFLRARLDEDERYAGHGGPTNSWAPRLLAEVGAKREIVEIYARAWADPSVIDGTWEHGRFEGLQIAVERLAWCYAGHPEYDAAWAPVPVVKD